MKFLVIAILVALFCNTFAQVVFTPEQHANIATIAASIDKRTIEQSPTCDFAPRYPVPGFNYTTEGCQDYSQLLLFVTGISSEKGQGRAIAKAFAEKGATVAGCARSRPSEVVNMTELTNLGIQYYRCDVSSLISMKLVAHKVNNDYNGQKVGVLVSNAGIIYIGRTIDAVWSVSNNPRNDNRDIKRYLHATNTFGLFNTVKAFDDKGLIPKDGTGKVVSTTSAIAEFALPWFNIYSDSKHAVSNSKLSFATDFGIPNNVSFIGIQPSAVDTNIYANAMRPHESVCPDQQDDVYATTAFFGGFHASVTGEAVVQLTCNQGRADVEQAIIAIDEPDYQGIVNLKTIWCTNNRKTAATIFNSFYAGAGALDVNNCY